MNALELHGVEKRYPDFTLGPIDFVLPGGTVCGLVGENGAGKTTTLKLILNMLQRDGGTIRVLGQEDLEASPCTKEDIGVVLSGEGVSAGSALAPVSIEELFVLMVKGEKHA